MFSLVEILLLLLIILFLLMWLTGVICFFVMLVSGISLRFYIKNKHPEIPISFFVFIHKKHWARMINYPKRFDSFFKLLAFFGSRKATENWINEFMDLKALRKLRDKKVDKHLNRLIIANSLAIRMIVLGFIIGLLAFSIAASLKGIVST